MTDYVQKFFKTIRAKEDNLYSLIVRMASEQYLINYLYYKFTGDSGSLEKDIGFLTASNSIDLHDAHLLYDAGLLYTLLGEKQKAKIQIKKSKHILKRLMERDAQNEALICIYHYRIMDCDDLLEKMDIVYESLESAYSEFCKTEDPKKAILELSAYKMAAAKIRDNPPEDKASLN